MKIVFLFYDGMTALDAVGPYEILSRLPDAITYSAAIKSGEISTDSHLKLIANSHFSSISEADILIIPGAGNATTLQHIPEVLEWIKYLHTKTSYTTSVCTGSLILGASGILKDKQATTHWAAHDRLSQWGAIPVEKRIVEDGKIITAAGVSAGIDMALLLASKVAGNTTAKALQIGIEYMPEPPFDMNTLVESEPELIQHLRNRMTKNFE